MGRIIELNGEKFARTGQTGPLLGTNHANLDYGPQQMGAAIDTGMKALGAINEISKPIINGVSRLAEKDPREEKLRQLREQGEHERADKLAAEMQASKVAQAQAAPAAAPSATQAPQATRPVAQVAPPQAPAMSRPVTDADIANQPFVTPHATEDARTSAERRALLAERRAAYTSPDEGMSGQLAPRQIAAAQAMGYPYKYNQAEARGNYQYMVDRDAAAQTVEQQAAEARARAAIAARTPAPVEPPPPAPVTAAPVAPTAKPVQAPPATAGLESYMTPQAKPQVLGDWQAMRDKAIEKAKSGEQLTPDELSAATGTYTHQQLKAMMAEARVMGDHQAMREVLRLSRESKGLGVHPSSYTDLMTGAHHDRALQELITMGGEPKTLHQQTPLEQLLMAEKIGDLRADNNPAFDTKGQPIADANGRQLSVREAKAAAGANVAGGQAVVGAAKADVAPRIAEGQALVADARGANAADLEKGKAQVFAAKGEQAGDQELARTQKMQAEALYAPEFNRLRTVLQGKQGLNLDARTANENVKTEIAKIEKFHRDALLRARIDYLKDGGDPARLAGFMDKLQATHEAALDQNMTQTYSELHNRRVAAEARANAPINENDRRKTRLEQEGDKAQAAREAAGLRDAEKAMQRTLYKHSFAPTGEMTGWRDGQGISLPTPTGTPAAKEPPYTPPARGHQSPRHGHMKKTEAKPEGTGSVQP